MFAAVTDDQGIGPSEGWALRAGAKRLGPASSASRDESARASHSTRTIAVAGFSGVRERAAGDDGRTVDGFGAEDPERSRPNIQRRCHFGSGGAEVCPDCYSGGRYEMFFNRPESPSGELPQPVISSDPRIMPRRHTIFLISTSLLFRKNVRCERSRSALRGQKMRVFRRIVKSCHSAMEEFINMVS